MAEKIKFEYGVPEELALKFAGGKNVAGTYGDQVLFTCEDSRVFYLDPEPASEVEQQMNQLGVKARDKVRITKVRHPRGGGSSFRVERVACETDLERTLVRSIEQRQQQIRNASPAPTWQKETEPAQQQHHLAAVPQTHATPAAIAPAITASGKLMACFLAAIDAVGEAQQYAARKGLGITFSSENVTSAALSCYINECKGGR